MNQLEGERLSVVEEFEALRKHLCRLAGEADDDLTSKYELQRPPKPPGLYWQFRWLAGRLVRWLQSKKIWRSDPWPVALKQMPAHASAKPLLLWAVGAEQYMLREACERFSELLVKLPGYAPVLITDVTDFAFFSRLGWLVEYLPKMIGEGESYENRKTRMLARTYRGAPAFPVNTVLACSGSEVLQLLKSGAATPVN